MDNISWLGVALSALALFFLGAAWYTVLFGKAYRAELGVPAPAAGEPPQAPPVKALAGQFVAGLVISAGLAWLVGASTAGRGAGTGLVAGVVGAAVLAQLYQFEGRSLRHLAINAGYVLAGLTLAGTILGSLQ